MFSITGLLKEGNGRLSCPWGVWPHWENWAKQLKRHTHMYFLHNILLPQRVTSRPPTVPPSAGHPTRQLSPHPATWAGNDFTRREWAHTVRQRPPSTAGQRLAESRGSVSAGVCTSACAWDLCKGRPLISGRRRTVWMTHVFVCEWYCGMSGMCDCPCTCVSFCFSMKCVCVCVCVHTRAGHAGGDIWHDGNSFDHPSMHCVTRGVYVSFKVMRDLFVVMATLTEDRGRPSCNEIITGRYLALRDSCQTENFKPILI